MEQFVQNVDWVVKECMEVIGYIATHVLEDVELDFVTNVAKKPIIIQNIFCKQIVVFPQKILLRNKIKNKQINYLS